MHSQNDLSGPITIAVIHRENHRPGEQELADRDHLQLIIGGINTGSLAASVTWRRNGTIVDRDTMPIGGGSFFDGGGETIAGGGTCRNRMYRVALLVRGYLPGNYTYTVNNSISSVTSPVFHLQGNY